MPTTPPPPAPASTIDARSIQILEAVGGMKSLSDKDRRDIAKNIDEKVLDTGRHPR